MSKSPWKGCDRSHAGHSHRRGRLVTNCNLLGVSAPPQATSSISYSRSKTRTTKQETCSSKASCTMPLVLFVAWSSARLNNLLKQGAWTLRHPAQRWQQLRNNCIAFKPHSKVAPWAKTIAKVDTTKYCHICRCDFPGQIWNWEKWYRNCEGYDMFKIF